MIIVNNIKKYENNNALITENYEIIKYKALLNFSEKISNNIKTRCLVFLLCNNNVETISGYIAFLKSDCVIMLLDEKISNLNLNKLISIYKPEFIFLKKRKINFLNNYGSICSFKNYELIKARNSLKLKINDKLLFLISTSGSTGSPKNVRQSYTNINENTKSITKYLDISQNDISITTLPMSYVYGLSIINTHLNSGGCIVLNNYSVIDKKFRQLLEKNKVTNFGGVPHTYQMLDKIGFYKFNLKYLKYTTQAGGKLNSILTKKIINNFTNLNKKFLIMYGAAEATARMSYLPWKYASKKIGSIGLEIPGGKFWIESNKKNKILNNHEAGELIFSGKNVCLGYASNVDDLSKDDENKGILRTGDIAKRDKDDFYYIVGRKDRYVKIYGMRINLAELEYNISDLGIQSICKINEENKITIFIKKLDDGKKLKNYLGKLTQLHPSVFSIKRLDKFPLNKNYKISYDNKNLN